LSKSVVIAEEKRNLGKAATSERGGPRGFRPTFGIASIMLLTLVFAVMASAAQHFVQAVSKGSSSKAPFVFATLTLPVVALLGVSLTRFVVRKWVSDRGK
jgi:hypothetical protein